MYNGHKDYASEIISKALSYPDDYTETIKKIFGSKLSSQLTDSQIYRIIYGNYVCQKEYGIRSLSKLTADILTQLQKM